MKILNDIDGANRVLTDSTHRFITDTLLSKLNGIATGAQVNVATNLALSGTGDSLLITSSTGANVSIPIVTTTKSGFMSYSDKSKLDGIASLSEVNQNAFAKIASTGQTTVLAADKTDTFNFEAGSPNVVVTTDNITKTISVDFVGGTYYYYSGNGLDLNGFDFSLGTPSTLTGSSTNTTTVSSHTHAIQLTHASLLTIGENDHHSRVHSMTSPSDHGNIGANTIIGRAGTTGTPQELSATEARSLLNVASGAEVNQTISAGNGLNFTATSGNVAITLGTPATLNATSVNSVGTTNHSHAITSASDGTASTLVKTDSEGNLTATSKVKFGGNASIEFNLATNSIDFIFN